MRTARAKAASGGNVGSSYNVGLGAASYELDLFGRVRSSSEAALQGYFASVANRDAAHLSLIATVAKAYFNERYAEEAMSLAQRVLKTREKPTSCPGAVQGRRDFRRRPAPAGSLD